MSKVVIVSQDVDFIPFDLKQFRCIIYESSEEGLDKLKLNLEEAFSEASRNSYRMSLKENYTIAFDKKIVGKENNLYSFKIEVPYIGYGLIKLIFSFEEFRIDKPAEKIESQFLFVSEDDRIKHLDIIPWTVLSVETKGNTGRISLDEKY
ncbi:hypothetical protein [Tenacibaculum ovolyticum]|uniref:hypothetical protein n=1 Tax=Tenacibaculum ovolyticum TaxID=104270 RepID=UPI0012FCF159|nr:hypothetical protein [Tenacibaculum ovolyticum]